MKYTVSINIGVPRNRVLEIVEDTKAMKHWQPDLNSFEPLTGIPGEVGSVSRIVYDMKGREMEMTETLESRSLPESLVYVYEAKGVWNRVVNRFADISDTSTTWEQENEFRFKGIMTLVGFLMPGSFRKESLKALELFKDYAERPSG